MKQLLLIAALLLFPFFVHAQVPARSVVSISEETLGTDTYTEGTTRGFLAGCIRNDSLEALGGTDNEIVPCQVDATGAIYVNVAAGGGHADDADFAATTTAFNPIGGAFDENAADIGDNKMGIVRMTANRSMHTVIWDASGSERGANVDASFNLQVDIAASSATVTVSATDLDVQSGGADLATEASLAKLVTDPCASLAPQPFKFDITGTTTTEIINESSSNNSLPFLLSCP